MCYAGCFQSANDLMVTHALGYMMYGYTLPVPMKQRVLNKSSKDYKAIINVLHAKMVLKTNLFIKIFCFRYSSFVSYHLIIRLRNNID